MSPAETIEREQRFAPAAALAAFLAVGLFVASLILLANKFGADGNAELLRKVDEDSGTLLLIYAIRAIGAALLAIPLAYLFQAAVARSEKMRGQFVGLVIAGPLFLAALALLVIDASMVDPHQFTAVLHRVRPDLRPQQATPAP